MVIVAEGPCAIDVFVVISSQSSLTMSCCSAYIVGLLLSLCVLYKILDRLVRVPRVGRYGDRYILVTGCGQGFGFEAVKRLERIGCHVFAGCRRQESVEKLKEIFSDRVHPFLMDVSNRDNVRTAFDYVSSNLPGNTGLWGLVNNAALGDILPFGLFTLEMYKEVITTNLYGVIDVTMTFLPLVKKARGRVVNVSSGSGRFAGTLNLPYCMSKYGLEAFSDGLRRSIHAFGCKVLIIEPGAAQTQMVAADNVVKKFEVVWRQAKSEGRVVLPEAGEDALQADKEKLRKVMSSLLYGSIDDVIDAYEHALFGVFPRARCVVGKNAKLLVFMQMLPEWLSDWTIYAKWPEFRDDVLWQS